MLARHGRSRRTPEKEFRLHLLQPGPKPKRPERLTFARHGRESFHREVLSEGYGGVYQPSVTGGATVDVRRTQEEGGGGGGRAVGRGKVSRPR